MATILNKRRVRSVRRCEILAPISSTLDVRVIAAAIGLAIAPVFPSLAQTLPTGGSVAAGGVSIGAPQNGTLNINQSTNQAIINWNTFSVGAGGTVNFNQPGASSATLNRVTSSTPSSIAGTINAPGTVMLVNPNGIAITKSGVINTGSFVASSLGIKNEDFLAGKYNFQGNGASAPVTNRGTINVSNGGFVALLGGRVSNSGVINAKLGKVGLGSGEMATIDLSGDGFMSVAVPSNQVQNLRDGHGRPLVSNSGKINANGGTVVLSAATAKNAFQQAVNVPGSIRANSVGVRAGKIVLNGGDGGIVNVGGALAANGGKRGSGGSITVAGAKISVPGKIAANGRNGGQIAVTSAGGLSVAGKVSAKGHAGQGGRIDLAGGKILVPGKIAASGQKGGQIAVSSTGDLAVAGRVSAKGRTGEGGRIDLAGKDIALTGAKVNASGATAGGLVRVGGAFQGGKADQSDPLYQSYAARWGALPPIAAATTVTIDAGTRINVSARHAGDGGTAIVWSEQTTNFAGSILALGGALGGDGGSVETSGKLNLQASGMVDAAAPQGAAGHWLLDPNNITIQAAGANTNVTASPNFTSTDDNAIVTTASIQAALNAGTSVTVTTASAGSNTQAGNITVADTIAKTAGGNATLTLNALNDITFSSGANVTSTTGALGLTLNAARNINTLQNVSLNGGTLTLNATGNGTQSGVISGNTSVTMSGAGTFTLSSTNTYTGVTTVAGGVLSVATIGNGGSAGNLGQATSAAGNLVLSGGTLQYTGATASTNRAFTLTAGTTSSIDVTTNTLTISGAGANTTGSFTKIGAGTLTLSGANAYTGTTTISAGTLTLGANNVLASASTVVVNGGTFNINTRNNTVAGVQLASGSITGTTGVLTSTTAYDVQSGTVSAILAGGVGLNKTTSGTVTLSGANTYSGGTTISAGTLQIGSGGTTGSVGGDIANNAALTFNRSNAQTYAGVISGTGTVTKSGAGTLTLTGNSTYTGGTTISAGTLQIGSGGTTGSVTGNIVNNAALTFNRSDAPTYAGVISGTGKVTKSGTGTLTLSGANTYSGATTISTGTLQAGATNAFSSASAHTVASGTFLDLFGFNQTIGSLAGAGTVTNAGGAGATLTTGGDNTSTTFSGVIQDGAGVTGLTKGGTGTFTLTGDSTHTGGTTISAGTLQLGSGGTTGSVTGNIVNNAALAFNRSDAPTYAGVISGTGTVTKSGTGTLTLTANNTYAGGTTISAGTLALSGSGSIASSSQVNVSAAAGTFDISGTSSGATITTLNGVTNSHVTLGVQTLTISNGSTTYAGIIQGTGGLTLSGGTQTLSGANTYTGATNVNAGTLQAGANTTFAQNSV